MLINPVAIGIIGLWRFDLRQPIDRGNRGLTREFRMMSILVGGGPDSLGNMDMGDGTLPT